MPDSTCLDPIKSQCFSNYLMLLTRCFFFFFSTCKGLASEAFQPSWEVVVGGGGGVCVFGEGVYAYHTFFTKSEIFLRCGISYKMIVLLKLLSTKICSTFELVKKLVSANFKLHWKESFKHKIKKK